MALPLRKDFFYASQAFLDHIIMLKDILHRIIIIEFVRIFQLIILGYYNGRVSLIFKIIFDVPAIITVRLRPRTSFGCLSRDGV